MVILNKRVQKLSEITCDMIKDGILTIPNGVTDIEGTLDSLLDALRKKEGNNLAESGISTEIKVVIFPKTLKTIDNFFYNNLSVKLAIFNSSVTLTSNYAQGTFENSNVEVVIIPFGFKEVHNTTFPGQVIRANRPFSIHKSIYPYDKHTVCTSFHNSKVNSLLVVYGENVGHRVGYIDQIETCYLEDYPDVPYHQISYKAYADRKMKMLVTDVDQRYITIYNLKEEMSAAIKKYTSITDKRISLVGKVGRQSVILQNVIK